MKNKAVETTLFWMRAALTCSMSLALLWSPNSMAKISTYPDGGAVQAADQFVVARSGSTFSIPGSAVQAWPVGSVFIAVVSTNPATLLGYGTWTAFGTGRVLVGLDAADPDFDLVEETGGAKTVAAAGTNSAPTFSGSALGTHVHGAGTLVPSAHSGTAVANHAALVHSGTAVGNHAADTTGTNSGAAVKIGTGASNAAPSGHTHSTPALVHSVTQPNDHAALVHGVTQPDTHTMSGSSEAVSAGTPAGTVTAPTFTGSATSVVQPYIVVYMWKRTT